MASFPYIQLYPADYLADTQHLNTLEHGAYLLLIMNYWQTGKPLPDDDSRLAMIVKLSLKDWKKIRPVIAKFFDIKEGIWIHYRIEADLEKVKEKSIKASNAGKESAKKRINEKLNSIKQTTYNEAEVNGRSTSVENNFNERTTDVPTERQQKGNHTDTDTDTDIDNIPDTDNIPKTDNIPDTEVPPLVDEKPLDKPPKQKVYKFTLADIEREDLQTFGYLHPELKEIPAGKSIDELTWFAGRVIKCKRGQLIQGVPFIEALAMAVKNLQSEDWFFKSGGVYWLLDVKAGKFNGENACVRIGKYMKPAQKRDGPQAKESVSDYIQRRVQECAENHRKKIEVQ